MWRRKLQTEACLTGLLLVLLAVWPVWAAEIKGEQVWRGQVELKEAQIVQEKAVLTIAAGTRVTVTDAAAKLNVRGRLLIQGTQAAPVIFVTPSDWQGIEFMEAEPGSEIHWGRFAGAKMAISSFGTDFAVHNSRFAECEIAIKLFRESNPLVIDSEFVDNQIAIDNEMKSIPTIRNNRFSGHSKTAILAAHGSRGEISGNRFENNKQALGLLQKYQDRVVDNQFIGNEVGIYCNQTQNTPLIEGNLFDKNGQALVNFSFAYPAVRNNRFTANETAMRNDQYGSAQIENNLFRSNGTALYNNRKSNPKVIANQFIDNELTMFCDYSSYPQVERNNFIDSKMAVKLGIYQSADWEKRSGSKTIMQREASERRSQNPLLAKVPTEFNDVVDVSGNYWGRQTRLLSAAGNDGNVEIFHDRRDQPQVTYEGYGPESYKLDRIRFAPWLETEVAEAGPQSLP
ncbi:MAG: hypothetical protein C0614_06090 [Desulfuromonas sp.]|nr:MAG: hypothetical protein C0614_06090 [Desulfuromonas sp.]